MTDPNKTNEEINEELSTDELKSVSGGGFCKPDPHGGETFLVGTHKGNSRPKLKTPQTKDWFLSDGGLSTGTRTNPSGT